MGYSFEISLLLLLHRVKSHDWTGRRVCEALRESENKVKRRLSRMVHHDQGIGESAAGAQPEILRVHIVYGRGEKS